MSKQLEVTRMSPSSGDTLIIGLSQVPRLKAKCNPMSRGRARAQTGAAQGPAKVTRLRHDHPCPGLEIALLTQSAAGPEAINVTKIRQGHLAYLPISAGQVFLVIVGGLACRDVVHLK